MSKLRPFTAAVSAAAVGLAVLASSANAGGYPSEACVAAKLKAAAGKCKADLTAWSKGMNGPDANSAAKLSAAWQKAEDKATAKGSNCSEMSLNAADTSTAIEAAVANIAGIINASLTLPSDAKCGSTLLKVAAKKCDGLGKADATYFKKFHKDPSGVARTTARGKAITKYNSSYTAAAGMCSAGALATQTNVENAVDSHVANIRTQTTTSPNLSTTWTSSGQIPVGTLVQYEGVTYSPVCSRSTPYQYWFKRGTVNKLLVYYQGGGACWDGLTCQSGNGAFDDNVSAGDNPANTTTGFGDLTNGSNPFSDWNAVFISYCTGDIHWGDNSIAYTGTAGSYNIRHRGYQNAKVVEKFAREHFIDPDEVFVTGSSAGAYGAVLHGSLLHEVFPASKFEVLGDAGNGVVTPTFIAQNLEPSWKVQQHLPLYLGAPLTNDITQLTIADLYIAGAKHYSARGSRYAQYTTSYDGGSGSQTFFYNVMVNGILDNGSFQHSTCAWNSQMLQLDADAFAGTDTNNYRSYVGPGSRHTIWGSNRVYTEVHGPVQPLVNWIDDMRNATLANWNNVACSDCSLLGTCGSGTNAGASCQHDSECPGGLCNIVDAKPAFKCNAVSANAGASCQRDIECIGAGAACAEDAFKVCSASSTSNKYKLCSTNADCPGGTCITEQPFLPDGIVSCPP